LNAIVQNNPLLKCGSSSAGHTFQSQEITPRDRRGRFHFDADDFTGRVLKNRSGARCTSSMTVRSRAAYEGDRIAFGGSQCGLVVERDVFAALLGEAARQRGFSLLLGNPAPADWESEAGYLGKWWARSPSN
jgi:hypothetical protein